MHYMELGGAEMALLGLLQALDTSKVEVDLFINQHTGPLMAHIPPKINLLPEIPAYSAIERPLKDILLEGHLPIFLARLWSKWKYSKYLRSLQKEQQNEGSITHYVFDAVSPFLPSLKHLGHYDLAISFLDPPHIVQDKVDASIKMEWIHTDFSTVKTNKEVCGPRWAKNDYIVSISDAITEQFLRTFPELKKKIIVIENIISTDTIRKKADAFDVSEEMPHNNGEIHLLSIGRFSDQKNFDNIPDICRHLNSQLSTLSSQLKAKWYLIGFGAQEELIKQKIIECGMQEHVIILGKRENPYPYIKACDIYVQPSRYEGKSITVREAQILCKPVIITDYPSAHSQITNGTDGIICPMDNASIANSIMKLYEDVEMQQKIKHYLATHDYGLMSEVNKIYKILNIS
ncbi:Glycosyltransferase involved in cell wall bisynthesis [Prevotella sp. tc2-28]|nr:Glycosyltransferase involved in cell wall bisynthesis [Prevotella sp. tc2-28]